MKYLFLLTLIPSLVFSQVLFIQKDSPAPYNGYLFTPEAEKKNADKLIELDYTIQQLGIMKEEQEALKMRLVTWQDAAKSANKELVKQERARFWENTLYFGLGAVLTGVLAVGVSRAVR